MSSGIASLHKILKDETRRKIVLMLTEKGAVSYTEIMETMDFLSTGSLNYHLKVLNDLIVKNETGQYTLTEKGKVASRLLAEFPDDYQHQKRIWQRRFFTVLIVGQIVYFTAILTFYFLKQVSFDRLVTATSAVIIGTIALYFGYRAQVTMPEPGSKQMRARMKKMYVCGGAWAGMGLSFFGGGLVLRVLSGQPLLHEIYWTAEYMVFAFVFAPIIGAYLGYQLGKRNGFEKPKWAIWLDKHF